MESKTVTLAIPIATAAGGLHLEAAFEKRADRFAHSVRLRDGQTSRDWLQSVEGGDADFWPASPPFQEALEQLDGVAGVIFLVGMAGCGHWSASVEASAADEQSLGGLVFDVACRSPEKPSRLGSRYQSVAPTDMFSPDTDPHTGAEWTVDSRTAIRLRALPIQGQASCRFVRQDGQLLITPPEAAVFPATIRWKYRVEVFNR